MKLYLIGSTLSNLNIQEMEKKISFLYGDTSLDLLGNLETIRSGEKLGVRHDELILIFTPKKIPRSYDGIQNPEKWFDINEGMLGDPLVRICYIFPEMTQDEVLEFMKNMDTIFTKRQKNP